VEPGHRRGPPRQIRGGSNHGDMTVCGAGDIVAQRPLAFYDAIGRAIALEGRP